MATETGGLDALGWSKRPCGAQPAGRGGMGTNDRCRCLDGIADPNARANVREALRIYRKHFVRGT